MFVVFDTLNLYACVFINCATSYCLYDTLMDPWNVYIYRCMCVCMYVCMYVYCSSENSPSARCVLSANLVCKDVHTESVLIYGIH